MSLRILAVSALSAALSAGCGSEGPVRVAVEGSVAFQGGGSLEAGVIRFIPTGETEGPVAVATIRDGSYELPESEGPVLGTHRIEIEAIDHYGFALDDEAAYVAQIEQKRRRMPSNPVPARYNRRSTLTAEVALDGDHTFDFRLEPNSKER
ncbi:MAG: hypothetical protein ACREJB_00340 [Planctomycetaceae bacterium]